MGGDRVAPPLFISLCLCAPLNRCSVPFPTPPPTPPIYLSLVVEGFVCINKWGEVGGGCFAGGVQE